MRKRHAQAHRHHPTQADHYPAAADPDPPGPVHPEPLRSARATQADAESLPEDPASVIGRSERGDSDARQADGRFGTVRQPKEVK